MTELMKGWSLWLQFSIFKSLLQIYFNESVFYKILELFDYIDFRLGFKGNIY